MSGKSRDTKKDSWKNSTKLISPSKTNTDKSKQESSLNLTLSQTAKSNTELVKNTFSNLENTQGNNLGRETFMNKTQGKSFLFFQPNSINIYQFNFSNSSFFKLENKKKYFFPVYQRYCELNDDSYLLTG